MKIYTNENNTSTLKLLIAANLANKQVEVETAAFGAAIFAGPRSLPLLEVDEQLVFFSSNAAAQYLFPVLDLSVNGQCQQMQEWEATRLHPTVQTVLTSKSVASDLKQLLTSLVADINNLLAKNKYILGEKLSAADISILSTLYPLYYNADLKSQYLKEATHIGRWMEELAAAKAVQEAIKQWGGSANGPFGTPSALGLPQVASLQLTPPGSPEESNSVEAGATPEEIESGRENWLNGLQKLPEPLKQEKVVLPVKGRKNILITSALPYVNNVPHLGNIIGCVLSADIFARYCRLCGYNTLYVCGTDEYGTATETKALEEGLTPRQICDKYFAIHNDVYRWFNIGFDHFGRTSTPEQTEIVQTMFLKLQENGFISTQAVDQLLCQKCDRFLADRFVEGTCHHPGCRYEDARGDQCDKCGKLINAAELIEPRCKVCGETPVMRKSEQLFIELGQLEPSLRTWVAATEQGWSGSARAVGRAWLRDGLKARAVTRDLKWGVAVPGQEKKLGQLEPSLRTWVAATVQGWSGSARLWAFSALKWGVAVPGQEKKVFYVWFDAPMGYLSITQCATKHYEQWWRPHKEHDVKLYQFMAKDNVPFHAVMFPAALIGVNEGHVLVSHLYATEYLNYEEGKFSKSRGVGVFGTDAQDTGIPSDVWRFYLASIRPETSDSSFSWVELGTRNNSELLNNLGNFCHRSLSFCYTSFGGKVPAVNLGPRDLELIALINREVIAYVQHMEKGRLREALRHVLSVSRLGNQHMQTEQPWKLLKGDDGEKQRGSTAIGLCCQIAALLCTILAPYTPETARTLSKHLNIDQSKLRLNPENPSLVQYLPPGHVINKPSPLFAKIEPEILQQLKAKYAGTQSERENKLNGDISTAVGGSIAELEDAVTKQGEKVRQIKSSTKDKSVWQPEVNILLDLKKRLEVAKKTSTLPEGNCVAETLESLEAAVTKQGEKVRQLKSSTKDKSVWQPEVSILLDLKKRLEVAKNSTKSAPTSGSGDSIEALEKAVAEQGDKVRKLKSSTKDKTVWQPEVSVLLDLKKRLAALQTK